MSKESYGTITLTDIEDTNLLGGHFIYNSDGAGVIQNIGNGPSNWGFNTWIGSDGIQLRDAATPYATLNASGLTLSKGGIKADINTPNNRVYLSSENYGVNLTINNHEASNWREVIGTKFGVDAEGNLYANNAHISGNITANSLTITSGAQVSGLTIGSIDTLQTALDGKANSGAEDTALSYLSYDPTIGLKIARSNPSSATTNYIWLTSDNVNIIKDSTHKAVIDSNGMSLYSGNAQNPVATFGATTTTIGQLRDWNSRIELNNSSFKLIQRVNISNNISDTAFFDLAFESNAYHPRLTFGTRETNQSTGSLSAVFGTNCIASGSPSVACGIGAKAIYNGQLACGRYNEADAAFFSVGDGLSGDTRHTCFKIDSTGETVIDNSLTVNYDIAVGMNIRTTGHITANGHTYHPIGEVSELAENTSLQVLTNATWTNISGCSLSLTAGTYIAIGTIRWPSTSSTSARIGVRIKYTNDNNEEVYNLGRTAVPYRSGQCTITATSIIVLTKTTNVYLQGWHSMGGDYPIENAYIQTVRIV